MALPHGCRARSIIFLVCLTAFHASALTPLDPRALLKKLEEAYAGVKDYKTLVEVKTFKSDGSSETEKFVYSFKKPNLIRIDFESPHKGMVLVYPDRNGKVAVQPSGLAHLLRLHLAPDSGLLKNSSGQRIDQTDIGLLISNIGHSLTDQSRGPAEITEEDGYARIRVLAVDHFRENVNTLYRFSVNKKSWLPGKVEEFTPDGRLKRSVTFEDLRVNNGFPDSFFQLDVQTRQSDERNDKK